MTKTKARALVLLSGGMDSTTLIHHVVKGLDYGEVLSLAFHYGQRHIKELDCAAWQADAAGVANHHVIELSFLAEALSKTSALVAGGDPVPDLADLAQADLDQPPTYVPNRNMMLLSIAAAYAEANGITDIFYGAQAVDEYGYWDCTHDFLDNVNKVLALNRRDKVTVRAPFLDLHKVDLLRMGQKLGVDYGHTWSCYRGGETPCATCPTCVERAQAFREAVLADPLIAN
jgi:7-cyano-7-deazaguanine synthase